MSPPSEEIDYSKPITVDANSFSASAHYRATKTIWQTWLDGENIAVGAQEAFAVMTGLNLNPLYHMTKEIVAPFTTSLKTSGDLHGQTVAGLMRAASEAAPMGGDDDLVRKLNNRLFTHNKDGSLNRVMATDVRDLFEVRNESDWPELFLTSNHALSADHNDVSGIMRGFRKLAQDTFGEPVRLLRHITNKGELAKEEEAANGAGKKAIILSAVYAEKDAWMNGAALIERLNVLRKKPHSQQGVSPAARRLSKLILSLMVEDPSLVDMDADGMVQAGSVPIILRADSSQVAQHINLMGYSKGGNVVTDAMRLLVAELRQKQPNGQDALFSIRRNEEAVSLNKSSIAEIVRHIGVLGVSTGEIALTKQEKEYGIRRTTIINEHDVIAGHFHIHEETKYGQHDDFYKITGSKDGMGHSPREALGYYEDGEEEKSGYLHEYDEVKDLLKCYFAASFDKVAFSDIRFEPAKNRNQYRVLLEFTAGVSIEDILAKESLIREKFQEAGLGGVGLQCDIRTRECKLVVNNEKALTLTPEFLDQLADGLDGINGEDVIVSRAVRMEINAMKEQSELGNGAKIVAPALEPTVEKSRR